MTHSSGVFHLLGVRRFLPLFITQLLGAFNDNLFKHAVVLFVVYNHYNDENSETWFSALTTALFTLPFFFLSAISGQLADSNDKAKIIRIVKTCEIGIMSSVGGRFLGGGIARIPAGGIGGAIGARSDRGRVDECESYLLRHEQSYRGYGYGEAPGYAEGAVGYHYPYPYPVMWVKVPIHTVRRGDCGCETVVEEWIEEEPAPPPARRAKRVKIQRVVATPGKRVRTGE